MKKKDVYVVADTPKKAKKLKKLLDMFKESVPSVINLGLSTGFYRDGGALFEFPYLLIDEHKEWTAYYSKPKNKTKASIKELRNILAKEHLKAGDVVFMRSFKGEYESILKIKGVEGEYLKVDKELFVKGSDSIHTYGQELIKDFIRYATEEEKALLEPKKELQAGKWYKTEKSLFNHQDGYGSYGFFNKKWKSGDWKTYLDDFAFVTPVEATEYEVKSALVEEAKKRGYKDGDIIRSLFSGKSNTIRGNEYDYSPSENILAINGNWVFRNGQWAEIIEKGAFNHSDIAIVELLHDTLLENHGYSLESKLLMDARMLASKIKSKIR